MFQTTMSRLFRLLFVVGIALVVTAGAVRISHLAKKGQVEGTYFFPFSPFHPFLSLTARIVAPTFPSTHMIVLARSLEVGSIHSNLHAPSSWACFAADDVAFDLDAVNDDMLEALEKYAASNATLPDIDMIPPELRIPLQELPPLSKCADPTYVPPVPFVVARHHHDPIHVLCIRQSPRRIEFSFCL